MQGLISARGRTKPKDREMNKLEQKYAAELGPTAY
jgi:hypothetical protein